MVRCYIATRLPMLSPEKRWIKLSDFFSDSDPLSLGKLLASFPNTEATKQHAFQLVYYSIHLNSLRSMRIAVRNENQNALIKVSHDT